jgi:hypothetical protein
LGEMSNIKVAEIYRTGIGFQLTEEKFQQG